MTHKKRVALITGGSRGIGAACVKLFLKNGYKVVAVSKNSTYKSHSEKENIGDLLNINFDLSQIDLIPSLVDEVIRVFGKIDVLINAVGVVSFQQTEEITSDSWDDVLDINLKSLFFMAKATVPYLTDSDHPRIINISSNAGRMGGVRSGACYAASKGGVIALTYSLASKLAHKGITVNCVSPGPVNTDMFNSFSETDKREVISKIPLKRMGNPDEIANAVLYFAAISSGFTTGAVLDVNGGLFMG